MPAVRIQYVDSGRAFGGAERITAALASAFDAKGAQVECLVAPGAEDFAAELDRRGIPFREVPEADRLSRALSLKREFDRFRPDIVHIHRTWPLSDRYASLAARLAGVGRVVATEHVRFERCGRRDRIAKRMLAPLDHQVVGVSRAVGRSLVEYWRAGSGRVTVVENGIDVGRFDGVDGSGVGRSLYPEGCAFRIGTIGRLEEQKNFALLLDAMPEITRGLPGAALVIVGEGSLRGELESRVAALGLGDVVRFAGAVPDVAPFFAAFDLFVLPSRWEGLPLTVLEAMAAGTPIVLTATEGTTEAVRDGIEGLVVPVDDPGALAAACVAAGRDREAAIERARVARHRVRSDFSLERMVEDYRKVYRS